MKTFIKTLAGFACIPVLAFAIGFSVSLYEKTNVPHVQVSQIEDHKCEPLQIASSAAVIQPIPQNSGKDAALFILALCGGFCAIVLTAKYCSKD